MQMTLHIRDLNGNVNSNKPTILLTVLLKSHVIEHQCHVIIIIGTTRQAFS